MWRGCGVGVLLAASGCARNPHPVDGRPDVALVYSAALRGAVASPPRAAGGLARRATWVDRARLAARAVVQVDAGDLAPLAEDDPGLPEPGERDARALLALRAYHRMGVDAVTVGERELALGAAKWRDWCNETKVPVVAANVVGADGKALFPAYRVIRAGEVTVGVFGVLALEGDPWKAPPDVTITDPWVAARAAVRSLRAAGARVIVGLFHVAAGPARSQEMAAATVDVDVVVLGHDGVSAPPRSFRTGARGVDVGRVDIRLAGRRALRLEDHLLAASPDVAEQLGVHLLVRVATAPIAATFTESVAALSKALGARTFGENWTYTSTALCVVCHASQAAQWKTTAHAQAFATLDLAGKSDDPFCMGCHMTGFLLPGGVQNLQSAPQFTDVGCEACHGPSTSHVATVDKRKGTSRTVEPVVCLGCHTPDQDPGFEVVAAIKRVLGPGHGTPPSPPK